MASGSAPRVVSLVGAGVVSFALAACSSTPDAANWRVRFGAGAAPTGTVSVHTEIRTDGCTGAARFEDDVAVGDGVGTSPGALPEGRYGFYAEARDTNCTTLMTGCVEVEIPVTGDIIVTVDGTRWARPPCEGPLCIAGVCTTPATMDLGVDLGAGDLGTRDLGLPPPGVVPQPLALSARNSFLLLPSGQFASAGSESSKQRGTPRAAGGSGWGFETFTGPERFVALAATQFTGYGLTADGTLFAWGTNVSGLLGTGSGVTTTEQPAPMRVIGATPWRTVDGGNQHVCAIFQSGRLACWGDRTDGRIGDGVTTGSATAPTIVGTALWTAVSAGERHTCGIQEDGSLWCWGYNSTGAGGVGLTSGQLGVGDTNSRDVPTRVGAANNWQSVSAGVAHTCGIQTDGSLWCWGESSSWGRLGLGPTDPGPDGDVLTPQRVTSPAVTWTSVAAGNYHTCGIAGGDVYCWGLGVRGATGRGTTATNTVPAVTAAGYTDVAVGSTHSCGRAMTGAYFCWGEIIDARTGTGVDPTTGMNLLVPTAAQIF